MMFSGNYDKTDVIGFFALIAVAAFIFLRRRIRRSETRRAEQEMREIYGKDWGC